MNILQTLAAHLKEQGYTADLWIDIPKGFSADHIKITTPRHPAFHINLIFKGETDIHLQLGYGYSQHSRTTLIDLNDPKSLDQIDTAIDNYLPLPRK